MTKDIVDTIMELEDPPDEMDEEDYFLDIQRMINTGMWSLQGSYGRTMMDAIESGSCCLGRIGCRDAYGNYIPSRTEVQEGTKGSIGYVRERRGEEWAKMIEEVED